MEPAPSRTRPMTRMDRVLGILAELRILEEHLTGLGDEAYFDVACQCYRVRESLRTVRSILQQQGQED